MLNRLTTLTMSLTVRSNEILGSSRCWLAHYVLQRLDMDTKYEGNVEATREDYSGKSAHIMGKIIGR